jgi:4-coumarate--CoA ligase
MLSSTKPPPIGVFFNFGSLYWMSGIGSTIFTTISGITRVFTKRSFDPDMFLDVVAKYKITDFFGAPAYMALLSKHPRLKTADLSSLRNMIIGGAAFPDHYKQEVEKYWPGRQLRIAYGMSELGGIGVLSFFDYKPGCAGKPLMNYRVRVCDDEGNALALNQVGEIHLSSNCKFLGYYGDKVATEETKATEGFLKTGDLGYLDEDGFVFVVGRKKEMMKYANVAVSWLKS